MSCRPFVVAGESLVDIVVPPAGAATLAPGGSPLNVAVGLARLGIDTVLVTEVGDDDHGHLVRDHLTISGVRLDPDAVTTTPTSTATARLDERGAATYDFNLRWTLAPRGLPEGARGLHVGSIGAALRPGRESVVALVREAAARGLLVTFDPNSRAVLTPDAEQAWRDVREVASSARLVKLSDEDLAFLQPGGSASDVAHQLLRRGTELVVVTAGGGGATAYAGGVEVEVRSRPVDVVDTVGAGDSFMAALVAIVVEHGLDDLGPDRLAAYLAAAHEAAAVTVSRRGADPPRREELPAGWPGL